jgi:hypothetical protein
MFAIHTIAKTTRGDRNEKEKSDDRDGSRVEAKKEKAQASFDAANGGAERHYPKQPTATPLDS